MIRKSGYRFSEKIMLNKKMERDDDSKKSHHALAVDGASLADRTVIANGFPDDLGKAICEIFVVQQFAGAGCGTRGRRG
jgi:hypothetical protein